jgi:hypothetical protein
MEDLELGAGRLPPRSQLISVTCKSRSTPFPKWAEKKTGAPGWMILDIDMT